MERVNTFKYLGALSDNGDLDADLDAKNTIRMKKLEEDIKGFCATEE